MTSSKQGAMVVLSGGQDSTICLGWALETFTGPVSAVSFWYGQKHERELEAAKKVVEFFTTTCGRQIAHEVVCLGAYTFSGTSPLINQREKLETYRSYKEMDAIIGNRVEKTFVPMRNAVFLTLAANRAICAGVRALVTGICQADNANYPDCREPFRHAMQDTINQALGIDDFYIYTPLIHLSKAQSIVMALALPHTYDALAFTHTAYDGEYPPIGNDHASVLRAQGFLEAGVPDPLVVRAWREGLMPLPKTPNYAEL